MSVGKIVACCVLGWAALESMARADGIQGALGSGNWQVWVNGVMSTDASFTSLASNGDTATFQSGPNATFVGTTNPNATAATTLSTQTVSVPAPTSHATGTTADAFINFGGPYPELGGSLTQGNAQPWYESPIAQKVFGGVPSLTDQANFVNQVFADVQATFDKSGLHPILTLDPNTTALHTLSVVSGVNYPTNPSAIGITDVGHNGFGFIDNFIYAQPGKITDFEWAVAHNISHELMHAFGVAVHHDTTGTYLDAASANWNLLTNSSTVFDQATVSDLLASNFGRNGGSAGTGSGQQNLDGDVVPVPAPEPVTLALWGLGALAGIGLHRRRMLRRAA